MPRARSLAATILLLASPAMFAACSGGDKATKVATFDPETFRPQIEAVEAILYKETPPDYLETERVAGAIMLLQRAMDERAQTYPERQAAQDLLFLAAHADATGEGGYALPDLSQTRRSWERYRDDVFGEADWFRTDSPGVAEAQKPKLPTVDPGQVYDLVRVIERLDDLIEEGEATCEDLGEPEYEPGYEGPEGRAQIAAWNAFYRDWDERLNDMARYLPPQPPFDGDTEYLMAYQEVTGAMNELRFVATGTGDWATPFAYQWDSRFRAARAGLESARGRLAMLAGSGE